MKRFLAIFVVTFLACVGASAQDFAALDALHDQRQFNDELAQAQKLYNAGDPQAAVVFRLVRAKQQLAADIPSSKGKEKIARFEDVIQFMKPLLEKAKGSPRDRATLYYWNAVVIGEKSLAKGAVDFLLAASEMRASCDTSISIDPGYGDPYYFKALLDLALPGIAGGNKSRMGQLYEKALQLDPTNIWYLTDYAISLKHRNWDANANKSGANGVPAGMSDLAYAQELAKKAVATYAALPSPTLDQKGKMDGMKAAGL